MTVLPLVPVAADHVRAVALAPVADHAHRAADHVRAVSVMDRNARVAVAVSVRDRAQADHAHRAETLRVAQLRSVKVEDVVHHQQ